MKKRQAAIDEAYEAQWDGGRGSHHPDYNPQATGPDARKATRETEELLNAIIKARGAACGTRPAQRRDARRSGARQPRRGAARAARLTPRARPRRAQNDIRLVYKKIEEGADVNFVFGSAYGCPEGYTPLMAAAHRARLEACKALLRAGADPNYCNNAGDLVLFWATDGGVEIMKLLVEVRRAPPSRLPCKSHDVACLPFQRAQRPRPRGMHRRRALTRSTARTRQYGADLDARTPKDWTPLSYAKAKGKYGVTHEKGIYPEDVLKARTPGCAARSAEH